MHVIWNAFRSALEGQAGWSDFKKGLSGILAFLGHKGLRQRYCDTCLDAKYHHLFANWKHNIVDWKWQYMEDTFVRLSGIIELFLATFSADKVKRPVGHAEGVIEGSIDPKCMLKIEELQRDPKTYAAKVEAHACFSSAVGRESRWMTGCKCHDHIWKLRVTDAAKLKLFQQEAGKHCSHCVWRGRRAAELARGHWKIMARHVKGASSPEFHRRCTILTAASRADVLRVFEGMRTGWSEEMLDKFAYWGDLPYLCLGMWPNDGFSQQIAKQVVEKFKAEKAAHGNCKHRVTFRICDPDSGHGFGNLAAKLVESGEMHSSLEQELMEANMVSTCEQSVEEIHARIYQNNCSVGRSLDAPSSNARVRRGEHFHELQDWRVFAFVVHLWGRKRLARELLHFTDMDPGFINMAPHDDCIKAIYHCLPAQIFKHVNEAKLMQHSFKTALQLEVPQIEANMKLLVDFCKDRLQSGVVFSLPASALPEADGSADEFAIVPVGDAPPPPALDVRNIVKDALVLAQLAPRQVKLGIAFKGHRFFRVLKSNIGLRFLVSDDGYKTCRIAVSELTLGGKALDHGLFGEKILPDSFQLDLCAAFTKVGTRSFLENFVVWQDSNHAMLKLVSPSAGNVGSRMRSLTFP